MSVKQMNKSPNQMTLLLNKIERRLGVKALNLPESLSKDNWADIIVEDTIPTFSRYFPHKITTIIDNKCRKDGFFFIDRDVPEGCKILGVKDIDWQAYRCDPRFDRYGINFATYDFISRDYGIDDVAFSQVSADFLSLFNLLFSSLLKTGVVVSPYMTFFFGTIAFIFISSNYKFYIYHLAIHF